MQSDVRVRHLLLRLEPAPSNVTADWDNVVERARAMRAADGGMSGRLRRGGWARGFLIAAAVGAIGLGAAGAARLLTDSGGLLHRHYPIARLSIQVTRGHGPAPVRMQRRVGTGERPWRFSRWNEELQHGGGRYLGSVKVKRTLFKYYAWPMQHRHGYCVFEPGPRKTLVAVLQDCAYQTRVPTPWVNRPPPYKYTLLRGSQPNGIQSALVARVSDPLTGYVGNSFYLGRPAAAFTLTGMIPNRAQRVEIRLQDGHSVFASVNRPFFFAVIHGRETTRGHRPVAVSAFTADGARVAIQHLDPAGFDAEQYALSQAVGVVTQATDDYISSNSTITAAGSRYTYHTDVLTTAVRIAKVFGGPPSRYPKTAMVVVFKGPITIPTRQPCANASVHCTLPAGHYAWIALIIPPVVTHLPPGFGSHPRKPNSYSPPPSRLRRLPSLLRLLKLAPLGTPQVNLARLGPWRSTSGVFDPAMNALPPTSTN